MNIYDMFSTDRSSEKEGIILNYGNGVKITVARAGGANTRFAKALETKMRPYRRQFDAGTMDDDLANDLLREAFAETVILGWEGITDRDGNNIAYNKDNCVKLFKDLPDLFLDVREQAMKAANFRIQEVETDAKN